MAAVKFPKKIGAAVDLLYERRAERLALGRQVDELKKGETALKDYILEQFTKDEINGAKGNAANAAIKNTTTVSITDWDAALAWVIKHKRWDLLRKQLSNDGVRELWEDGKAIPGVEPFTVIDLSLTKV